MCFISGRTLPFKVATTPIRKGVKKAVNQSPRLKQMSTVQVKEKWSNAKDVSNGFTADALIWLQTRQKTSILFSSVHNINSTVM